MTPEEQRARLGELGVPVPVGATDDEVHQLLIRSLSSAINATLDEDEDSAEMGAGSPGEVVLRTPEARPQLPSVGVWAHLATMAEVLAKNNLVKASLRGKPNDVLMVLLTGYDLGITATQALAKINIIEGQPSAAPELILALIRRDGHLAWPGGPDGLGIEQTDEDIRTLTGVVHAVRRDDPERIVTMRFSIADAERAGLCTVEDNTVSALSRENKPLPWQHYTEDLLWARAVSRLGRRYFSDVLLGLTYVPEELGYIDVPSVEVPVDDDPVMMPSRVADLRKRIEALPPKHRADLQARWKGMIARKELRGLDVIRDSEWELADSLVSEYQDRAQAAAAAPAEVPCERDAD